MLLAAEILRNCKQFVEEGVHPQVIVKSLRLGTRMAIDKIKEISVKISNQHDKSEQRSLLIKCAATTLSSKLVAHSKEFFANMVVEAVMMLDELLPLNMIGIKKVQGGALEDSRLIAGVAFKKTFSYAGFEMQPKKYSVFLISIRCFKIKHILELN